MEPPKSTAQSQLSASSLTLDHVLLLAAQEIALENSVPLSEVVADVDQWRQALGKWTRTVEALYKLCSSASDWAALKLEPTEKRVIKKKCEEVFAQIQAQQHGATPGAPIPSVSVSASSTAIPIVDDPKLPVKIPEETRRSKTPTPGGPDGGVPHRIKVPMKGSDTVKPRKEREEKKATPVSSPTPAPPATSLAPSPAPLSSSASAPPVSPLPLKRDVSVTSPPPMNLGPAVAPPNTAKPMAAGSTDLSVAITKIFELVKQKAAKELRLSGKQLEKQHLKLIFDSLMQTNVVSHVELRQASLGDEGATLIAKFLKSNKYPTLTSIDLSGNLFKPAALEELVGAVAKNFYILNAVLEEESQSSTKPIDTGIITSSGPSIRQRVQLVCESNKHLAAARAGARELRLPGRSLTEFPDFVCTLSNLTVLDLNSNDLTAVSLNIEGLRHLERLILNKNQLETLPAQIGLLPRLTELNLSNNCLTAIPPAVGLLANLEDLNVSANRLTELPRSLGGLLKLKSLKCSKNPWKKDMVVPKNVIAKGDDAVLAYLRNLFTSGEAYMNRMKLMFVGNGNVGKTSLLAAFKKQKLASPNVATDGIDISTWAPDERITFNAWDFAGQEVYYATHSFFLSPQAIYLIVFNCLEDEHTNKIEYWLRSIHARAGKPPVVLVGTHLDEMSRDAGKIQCENLQSKWQAQYKNIELVTAVSPVTGKGIKELQKELVRIAMKQKWMDKTIPKNYLLVQQKIEALKGTGKAPWLDWSAYRSLILECGVSDDDVAHVTDFLVNLGDIAYCPTASKSPEADKVVLDSQWLTKAFATIITMKTNFVKDGLLAVSALQHLWAAYPPEISQYLVALFERYELLYRIDDQTLLVPSMLKEQRPAQVDLDRARFSYSAESELGRIYQLDFVPTGLFSRIVVRLLSLRWKPNVLWRYGFVLSGEECCVLLELDLREQLLKLHIRGIHIQRNLILFTDGIQALLREWRKLKYKIFVPCPSCHTHRYTLAQLDEAVQTGKRFVVCPSTRAQVRLDAVVPDITMSQLPKIDFSDLSDLQLIGKGSYASVYKCTWKGRQVAVKQVTVPVELVESPGRPGNSVSAEFRREVWLMSGLKHRNFVQLFGVSQSPLCFVMEFCSKGSLAEFLSTCGKLDWSRRLPLLEDIANGMNYLHQHNPPIVHRDLKSPNVLLTIEANNQLVAKVGDVGIAQGLLVASRLSIRGVDCPVWVAPEILQGSFYNEKSDVYSYAIILWEVLTQSAPFGESLKFFAELEKRIIEGVRPELPEDIVPAYRELLTQCWDNDPRKRPAFSDVLLMLNKVRETTGGPSTHVDS